MKKFLIFIIAIIMVFVTAGGAVMETSKVDVFAAEDILLVTPSANFTDERFGAIRDVAAKHPLKNATIWHIGAVI